ncbi:hypothetical protein FGE12_26820 [Aggregicoccus sp. 17bor-14]|uniref:hypothetical protein n=1 Tax=Myxococcaceae TaxID=31 RepID=UPI00129C51C6|nr:MULTISPECIES: hypothetical protein [Myxococcaceae]MBF5046056.1 hypothetical protein [Simulacricoccus sp. 17bor-14]MRI91786.1 hypothetical protein [Aggregicoccus sp. 17bor-14]
MALVPELFANECDRTLPVGTIVDRYDLSQLIPLSVRLGDLDVPVLLNPFGGTKATVATYVDRGLHRRADGTLHSYASASGGVSVEHLAEGGPGRSLLPLVPRVEVASAADLLASEHLEVDGEQLRLRLSADAARALLGGQPAVVRGVDGAGHERHVEVVVAAAGADDGPLSLAVADLPAFLARPVLGLGGGRSVEVKLSVAQRRELLATGHTRTQVGGAPVELDVASRPVLAQYAALSTPAPVSESNGSARPPPGEGIPAPALAALPVALYVPIRQEWELLGYSRGALLHTAALAPQEELTLEVHSWEKHTTSAEDTASTEATTTGEFTDTSRDTTEVLKELVRTSQLSNNLGGNLSYSGYGLTVGVNGGLSDGGSVTDTARSTTTGLHEVVVKSTAQLKATRQVKVSEGSDIGSEERVTRRVRNPNTCRCLAVDSFEVLSHYRITTTILRAEARPCVLVELPLPFTTFNRARLRQYESLLSPALLDASLKGGFAAARLLAARDFACQVACERCLCGDAKTLLLSPAVSDALTKVQGAARDLRAANPRTALAWIDALLGNHGGNSNATVFDPTKLAPDVQRWLYTLALAEESRALYELLVSPATLDRSDTLLATRSLLGALGGSNPDDLRPDKLVFKWRLPLEDRIFSRYLQEGFPAPQGGKTAVVSQLRSWWSLSGQDAGLAAALKELVAAVQSPAKEAAEDPVASAYPVTTVAASLEREEALLAHLNEHREYYRMRVFLAMPLAMQRELLRSRGYELPGIELRPLGREGALLAYPLQRTLSPALRQYFERVLGQNTALDAPCGVSDVVLPTPGIHLQTRLSPCDACEPYLQGVREAEVRKRNAEADVLVAKAKQEQVEVRRLKKRLRGDTPVLDDPFRPELPQLRVAVESVPSTPPPAPQP